MTKRRAKRTDRPKRVGCEYGKPPHPDDRTALAVKLGVSVGTVDYWQQRGVPRRKGDGLRGAVTFDVEEVKRWLKANGIRSKSKPATDSTEKPDPGAEEPDEIEAHRLTKAEAEARIKQLEVEKRQRIEATAKLDLLDRADVERRWLERVQLVGAGLLNLSQRLPGRLVNKTRPQIRKILDKATRDLLTDFSEEWPA